MTLSSLYVSSLTNLTVAIAKELFSSVRQRLSVPARTSPWSPFRAALASA